MTRLARLRLARTARELNVELDAALGLDRGQRVLEVAVARAQHHVGVHVHQAAVAVVREALVGVALQVLDHCVVEAQVEDRVHHAWS